MRFTTAWASIAAQNLTLKVAILCITSCCLGLLWVCIRLSLREPLVIERSCFSKQVQPVSVEHPISEIESFAMEVIQERFATNGIPKAEHLSAEELQFRKQEQDKLKSAGLKQSVVVNSLDVKGTEVKVDADKLVSVGAIRSAFPMPLLLILRTVPRNEANHYGLVLWEAKALREEKADEKR